jgi:Domain of unknown function (DUF4412)
MTKLVRLAMSSFRIPSAAFVVSCAWALGCDHTSAGTAADAGVAATPSATPTPPPSATASVVDKALSFLSGGQFEGDITMTLTPESKAPFTSVFEIKGDKVRMNTAPTGNGDRNYSVVDYGAKKIMAISDSKKTAMVMNWDSIMGAAAAFQKKQQQNVAPVATGKKDVVAGYVCDIYKNIDPGGGGTREACVAKGLRFPQMESSNSAWLSTLGGDDWFPMRVDTKSPVDKSRLHMEVTQVDKKSLADSVFAVPPGYKTMDVDDLGKIPGGKPGKGKSHK